MSKRMTVIDWEPTVCSEDCDKPSSYAFKVPNAQAIDYARIDREHYEDSVVRGSYHDDAFIVTSKLFGPVCLLGISKQLIGRFTRADGIELFNMPFAVGIIGRSLWGSRYGMDNGRYSYYFISPEQVAEAKRELAKIRKIYVPRTTVSVTTI